MEHKIFHAEIKEFDDKELIVTHFISTERRDRGGDIMRANGMKISGKVVVLMAHGMSNLGQEPIAKPVKIEKAEFKGAKGIMAKTQFYDGSHLTPPDSTGRRLYEKAKGGFMPNWSIGWLPIKWEPRGQGFRDILEWELLEYSPVGVPMNPDAQSIDKQGDQPWFKVLPTPMSIFTKSFENYRLLPDLAAVRDAIGTIKCYLGKGHGYCLVRDLPKKIEEINLGLIRREIRRAKGRVD